MTNLVEIKPDLIDRSSLNLVQERRIQAYADTFDGRRVVYSDCIFLNELNDPLKLVQAIKTCRYFLDNKTADLILDPNAVVHGGDLWRRGRNLETVKISGPDVLDAIANTWFTMPACRDMDMDEVAKKKLFDAFRQVGVWEIKKSST